MRPSGLDRLLPTGALLWLLAAPGCSFVLDFEELRDAPAASGADDDDDASLGDASAPLECDSDCDDGDPCTVDTCDTGRCVHVTMECEETSDRCTQSVCVQGRCQESAIVGIVPDGVDEAVWAGNAQQTTLVAAGGRAYSATYADLGDGADIVLTTLGVNDEEAVTRRLASGLPNRFDVASPAALAPEPAEGGGVQLFLGIQERDAAGPGGLGNVVRVMLNDQLELADSEAVTLDRTPSFLLGDHLLGPAATSDGQGGTVVAWYGSSDGMPGVFVHGGGGPLDPEAPGDAFLPEADAVAGLVALGAASSPAAAWLTAGPGGRLRLASKDGGIEDLALCNASAGQTSLSLHASRTLDTLWTLTWTLQADTTFTTESAYAFCDDGGCHPPEGAGVCSEAETQSRVRPGVRELVLAPFTAESAPATLWQASAVINEFGLGLVVNGIDLDSNDSPASEQLSLQVAAPNGQQLPEAPAVAMLSQDRVVVSWLERSVDGEGDTLHLQRHRICLGN